MQSLKLILLKNYVLDVVLLVNLIFDNAPYTEIADLNNDQLINVLDVVLLTNIILGFTDFNEAGDLNLDGLVNVVDVVLLINLILGT